MGIIAKQSIKGTLVTYIGVAIGFITTFFVLTRFLSTEEVGLARILIDAATLFVGLAQLGTNSSIIRFFPYFQSKQNRDHGFFFWTLVIPFVGFSLFALIYWIGRVPISSWFGEKAPLFVHYYYAVLPLAFFLLYQSMFETSANVLMNIVVPRAVREIGTRVGLLAVYLLYATHILSMDGFVIAISMVYAVCAVVNLVYLISLGHITLQPDWQFLRDNPDIVRCYLRYTVFLIISAMTTVLTPLVSSFFVTAKMGLSYTGVFAIATYIAVIVSIPYRSVTAIASPELAAAIKDDNKDKITSLMRQCINNLLLIGGFILLAIWFNIDLIYAILPNGEDYVEAKQAVLYLGLSQLILATFNITLNTLNYSHYYAFSLLWSFCLTGASIVLNSLLIPKYGMNGAALSNLAGYALYFVGVILTILLTCKTNPLSGKMLQILLVLAILFGLNYLWQQCLPIPNIWLSGLIRSTVLLTAGLWVVWKCNLSPEINEVLRSVRIQRK